MTMIDRTMVIESPPVITEHWMMNALMSGAVSDDAGQMSALTSALMSDEPMTVSALMSASGGAVSADEMRMSGAVADAGDMVREGGASMIALMSAGLELMSDEKSPVNALMSDTLSQMLDGIREYRSQVGASLIQLPSTKAR